MLDYDMEFCPNRVPDIEWVKQDYMKMLLRDGYFDEDGKYHDYCMEFIEAHGNTDEAWDLWCFGDKKDEPKEEKPDPQPFDYEEWDEDEVGEWEEDDVTYYLGDYIETYDTDEDRYQGGYILDVIFDRYGRPACFKVWTSLGDDWREGGIDYIQASNVMLHEYYGDTDEAMARLGYKKVSIPLADIEDPDYYDYYVNEETKDVAIQW